MLTRGLQFTLDIGVLVLAFVFAYLLRFEFSLPEGEINNAIQQLPYVVLVQFAALALAAKMELANNIPAASGASRFAILGKLVAAPRLAKGAGNGAGELLA